MNEKTNVLIVGNTGGGKSLAAAKNVVESSDEAAVVLDPHSESTVQKILIHENRNLLYDRLSDLDHSLGYAMLTPSTHTEPLRREMENQIQAEAFIAILLRRRDRDSLARYPLVEEWSLAAVKLFLNRDAKKNG